MPSTAAERRAARKAAALATRKRLPPTAWFRPRIEPYLTDGLTVEQTARKLAALGDALFAFDRVIGGPIGAAVEAVDGEVLYLALLPIVRGVRRGMERAKAA